MISLITNAMGCASCLNPKECFLQRYKCQLCFFFREFCLCRVPALKAVVQFNIQGTEGAKIQKGRVTPFASISHNNKEQSDIIRCTRAIASSDFSATPP